MAYGDLPLDAPDKPNKGKEGGACNRRSCQAEPALWYNHGMYEWYCHGCMLAIGNDHVNRAHWDREWFPRCGHPQFETREMMDARLKPPTIDQLQGEYEKLMKALHSRDIAKANRQTLYELAKLVPQYAELSAQAEQFYLNLCQALGVEPEPVFDLEAYMQTEHYQGIVSGRIK